MNKIFIVLLLTLLLLEPAYRSYRLVKYYIKVKTFNHPLLVYIGGDQEYKLKPNAKFKDYKINSMGFRDREFDIKGRRILALGDSFTFGWEEKLENTYPKLLEEMLGIEVINAGVYGYNTVQEYEFLKTIPYEFDMVILGFVINDAEPQHTIPINPKIENKYVYSWFWETLRARFNLKNRRYEHSMHYWEDFEKKKIACFDALKKIDAYAPLLVVVLPSPSDNYECYKIITNSVTTFCKENNIDVLDLSYLHNEKDITHKDGHFNRKGNEIIAKILSNLLPTKGY